MSTMKKRYRLCLIGVCVLCITTSCTYPPPEPQTPVTVTEQINLPIPTTEHTATPLPTATSLPSPAYSGAYVGTPTPNATPADLPNGEGIETYTVQPGETLSYIALVFGCTVDEIVAANGLSSANAISAGQALYIPITATETGPYLKLVPDSEMVYGPAYIHFDLTGFVAEQGGYLASYSEWTEGRERTGTEIVRLVSQRFSVGPRVLLTLLEIRAGWVTHVYPTGNSLDAPIGNVGQAGLFNQLSWAAIKLNEGYYGWKRSDRTTVHLRSGHRFAIAPELNPGSAGVQNCLAELALSKDEWLHSVGPEGFLATYEGLFGNPFAYTIDPLIPADLTQPELKLPWEAGKTWYHTGGPHGGWGNGSGRAALDFVPSDKIPYCAMSSDWVTAAAPGLVLRSHYGEVIVDLDGDGFEQSGWVLLYMHVHNQGRVAEGTYVTQGQLIGHPSCEGGFADAAHLHFARRYNGEWLPAGSGLAPMVLSGWTAHEDLMPYNGTMTKGDEVRTAAQCWTPEINGLVSDNTP
jgi:murein DD-endopeptidase MepM/ murein hydrolase activator NlpD